MAVCHHDYWMGNVIICVMVLSGDQLNEDDFLRITGKIYVVILCMFIYYLVHLVCKSIA